MILMLIITPLLIIDDIDYWLTLRHCHYFTLAIIIDIYAIDTLRHWYEIIAIIDIDIIAIID
jgi:hypothetical protein